MNSEMRNKLEEMAEKYGDERAKSFFPVDERAMVGTIAEAGYLSGAEAGFRMGLEAAASIALDKVRCDDRTNRLHIAEDARDAILALGED